MKATDFLCGLIAGWSQIIVGQPFDFVKVRVQTAIESSPQTIRQIATDIYSQYGLKGFYRGSSSLFFGFAFTIGTEFLIYEWAKKVIYRNWGTRKGAYDSSQLKIWEVVLAGGIVGASVACIYCPVQYVKIKKQLSRSTRRSSLGLLFNEFINNGSRNIYKGLSSTILKETFGSSIYYGSYEYSVRTYKRQNREAITDFQFMKAGAIAGLVYHFFTYPIDTVKTNIQDDKEWKEAIRMSLRWSKINGYKVVLTRAILVNAFSFMIYEKAQRLVRRFDNYYYSMY